MERATERGAVDTLVLWGLTLLTLPGVLRSEWAVEYSGNPLCAIRGSTVVIPCSYKYPDLFKVETVMWCHDDEFCNKMAYVSHSNNTDISDAFRDRAEYLGNKEKNCTLQIKNITKKDAELKVAMTPQKEVKGVSEGDSVNLTCGTGSCSLSQSEFTWFKDNQQLPETQSTLHFSPVCKSHSANYSCGLKGNRQTVSESMNFSVKDDAWTVRYTERNLCAARGSTVFIQCEYEYPEPYKVNSSMWSRNDVDCTGKPYVYHSNNADISAEYTGRAELLGNSVRNCTLQIKNIRKTDAGEYRFRFVTNGCEKCGGPGVTLQVAELKVVMTSSRVNGTMKEGDSVNLTCDTDSCSLSQSEFTWFKDNKQLPETQSTLHFSPISYNHTGKYSCALKGHDETMSDVISLDFQYIKTTFVLAILCTVLAVLIVFLIIILCIVRRKDSVNEVKDTDRKRSFTVTEEYANIATTSQLGDRRQEVSSQLEDTCYASVTRQPEKKTNSWEMKNVTGRPTSFTEDTEYGNITRPDMSPPEDDVCYASIQLINKHPKNKRAVSREQESQDDDAVIYSAVGMTASLS
ncbi:B-cell receptor CD22-like isoform X2 [Brienomyrus brachyistius]|uniref:B-cell receptor CD22-like isoform X2 n=1 Tax=Brienomyrus brachyistius TaxID=42636 RepID=UPI0020B3CF94|nr:B-cell receptor CD22-like isoform X2 [Brienomyrus brachyistius]